MHIRPDIYADPSVLGEQALQPYQQRVLAERRELAERLEKLNVFLSTRQTAQVGDDEWDRLNKQQRVMGEYLAVLDARIAAWS